jgi:integrase
MLAQVELGGDPVLDKRKKVESGRNSLTAVAERYLAREGAKLRTTAKRRANLERLVFPTLGARQIDEIKRSDVQRLLDEIEEERGEAMADQVLAILRRIFNWHAARSDNYNSPIVRGMARRKAQDRERDRILTDDELRAVWRTAETYPGPWGQLIRFLLLTATRRTEASSMTWSELAGTEWTIPAQRYKTGTAVTLPLSSAARKVLDEILQIQGCDFVFSTDGRRPVSGFSTFKLKFDIACGATDWPRWTLHDLRRTARSLMSRARINADVAERCLGHVIPGIRGVYDRYTYLEEMRHAFEALAAQVDRIVNPQPNVVGLRN